MLTVEELRRRAAARNEAHEQHVGGQLVLAAVLGLQAGQQKGQELGHSLLFHLQPPDVASEKVISRDLEHMSGSEMDQCTSDYTVREMLGQVQRTA